MAPMKLIFLALYLHNFSCFGFDLPESFIYASSFNVPIYLLGDMNCHLESSDKPEAKA